MTTKKSLSPKPRYLKIGYQIYESQHRDWGSRYRARQVPSLRLSGDWLSAAGFMVGQKARVEVIDQGIAILPEN